MNPCFRLVTKSFRLLIALSILLTSLPAPTSAAVRAAQPPTVEETVARASERPAFLAPDPSREALSEPGVRLPTFDSPLPAPEPEDDGRPELRLYAITDLPVVELGVQAVCTITVVNEGVEELTKLTLSAVLPSALSPMGKMSPAHEWNAAIARLAAGAATQVTLPFKIDQHVSEPLKFEIELRDGDSRLRATTTAIVGIAEEPDSRSAAPGGGAVGFGNGRMEVDFPLGAVRTTGEVQVTARIEAQRTVHSGRAELEQDEDETESWAGALLRFSLKARDAQGAPVVSFEEPITLTVDLKGLIDKNGPPAGWYVYLHYLADEESGRWESVPVQYDPQTGLLTAEVSRFSTFEAGTFSEGWQLLFNPPAADTFSGAASFHYPIQIPAGRNGLQPQAGLSYNSRQADGLRAKNHQIDQGPVGLGWSLDSTVDIVRERTKIKWSKDNQVYYLHVYGTFSLVLNGTTYELEPDVAGQKCGRYRARNGPGLYIDRRNANCSNGSPPPPPEGDGNETTDYWIVRQPDGTEFRLGYTNDSEAWMNNDGKRECNEDFCSDKTTKVATRWRVDTVTDTMGNLIEFAYDEVTAVTTGGVRHERSRLTEIKYNNQELRGQALEGPKHRVFRCNRLHMGSF